MIRRYLDLLICWQERGKEYRLADISLIVYGQCLERHGVDLGVDGWIILGWISRRWDVGIWTGLGWPRIETGGERL